MEVVRLLEAEGRKGRLWLIDSSPDFLKNITKLTLLSGGDNVQNELQVKIITRFLDLIWPQAAKEVSGYQMWMALAPELQQYIPKCEHLPVILRWLSLSPTIPACISKYRFPGRIS